MFPGIMQWLSLSSSRELLCITLQSNHFSIWRRVFLWWMFAPFDHHYTIGNKHKYMKRFDKCKFWDPEHKYCLFLLSPGQVKMAVHMMHLCEGNNVSELVYCAKKSTLIAFLRFLSGTKAFDNIFLRHYLFCILQIIAGRLA